MFVFPYWHLKQQSNSIYDSHPSRCDLLLALHADPFKVRFKAGHRKAFSMKFLTAPQIVLQKVEEIPLELIRYYPGSSFCQNMNH